MSIEKEKDCEGVSKDIVCNSEVEGCTVIIFRQRREVIGWKLPAVQIISRISHWSCPGENKELFPK